MAIAPRAAITYPSFFMLSSSVERGLNIGRRGTFPGNPRRILNGCSASINARALFDDRLIHHRVDLLAIVPADRSGRRGQIHHREFFLRIGPPVGAAGAGPGELSDR